MNEFATFLVKLKQLNVKLWNNNGQLGVDAPDDVLTPALIAELQSHKAQLVKFLARDQSTTDVVTITPVDRTHTLPLSFTQQQLWFLDRLDSGNAYNMPYAFKLHGALDVAALRRTFIEIVRRHEVLRTTINVVDNQPQQLIHAVMAVDTPLIDLRHLTVHAQEAEVQRLAQAEALHPFDLTQDFMLRATLLWLHEQKSGDARPSQHVLLLTIHHIASDGWSYGILLREMQALYGAFSHQQPSPLYPLPLQYADYAHWQRQTVQGEQLASLLDFWRQQLTGAPPFCALPTDHPRPLQQTFRGATERFTIDAAHYQRLKAISNAQNSTLFATLLTAFTILLAHHSGTEDIVVGTASANRPLPALEELIGFFANVLVLRTDLRGNPTFTELLEQVRQRTQVAYEHQLLPVELVIQELRPVRNPAYNPLYQIIFALHNIAWPQPTLPGLRIEAISSDVETARVDLEFHLVESGGAITGHCTYNVDLFEATTVRRLATQFTWLLQQIVATPQARLATLTDALAAAETHIMVESPGAHEEIEQCLLQSPAVQACCVLTRVAEALGPKRIAYVVPTGAFSAEALAAHLRSLLPAAKLPYAYVPLSSLPLTATGQMDVATLQQIEVIDHNLPLWWEQHLQTQAAIQQVAVVTQTRHDMLSPLSLPDLLPAWQSSRPANSKAVAATVAQTPIEKTNVTPFAISHGKPLVMPEGAPMTLAELLVQAAQRDTTKGIMYLDQEGIAFAHSYAELLQEAERILAGLRQVGLKPQDTVIFQFTHNADFIAAFWACMLGGFVPAPIGVPPLFEIDNNLVKRLCNVWRLLDFPIILTSAATAPALRSLSALIEEVHFQIVTIDELRDSPPDTHYHPCQPDDLALLLLTSGSTGIPKAVMQTHRTLIQRCAADVQHNGFTREDRSFNWFPLDHVGGLVMFHLRDVYTGCQQFHAPTNTILQQPLLWLQWIDRYRLTITWSPNFAFALINALEQAVDQGSWDLSSLHFILNAGEAIVAAVARKFLNVLEPHQLPRTAMHPAWGMSETCSAVTYNPAFTRTTTADNEQFVEVGVPIPGISIRIVDDQNQVLPEGCEGRLQITGATITVGYYQNPALNQEVFTDDGWFNTGDRGVIHQGALTIVGRDKETIIINGVNYHGHEIEALVEEIAGVEVSYTVAVAIRQAENTTDQLALFFVPTVPTQAAIAALMQEIRRQIGRTLGITPTYLLPVVKEQIPKTAIGKIQRTQLVRQFYAGEFAQIRAQYDSLWQKSNTLPAWFHQKVWRDAPRQGVKLPLERRLTYLILSDTLGLGAALQGTLQAAGHAVTLVEAGESYAQLGVGRYRLNPAAPRHYQQLVGALTTADAFAIDRVLHLWSYDGVTEVAEATQLEAAQTRGLYSLLHLTQALAAANCAERPLELLVVTDGVQPTVTGEPVAYAKAPLLGLLRTLPHELPWLTPRHVDLECALPNSAEQQAHQLQQLQAELAVITKEAEIAYRGGTRLAPRLTAVDFSTQPPQPLPLQQEGFYLISGGLGGIGAALARYLLTEHKASLLLVGRTPLTGEKQQAYAALTQLAGQVCYAAVDIGDAPTLRQVVATTAAAWGKPLAGVFHLAGLYQEQLVTAESQTSLAAVLRPKMLGAWALHQLLQDNPNALCVTFSSVFGLLGGTALSAYTAANSFLDVFSHHQQQRYNSYTLAWSMWDEIGMSHGYGLQELTRSRGYQIIAPTQGVQSLLVALAHQQRQVWVGLDGGHPLLQRHLATPPVALQKLTAFYTTAQEGTTAELACTAGILTDAFGVPSPCELVPVESLPLTPTGLIDRNRLRLGLTGAAGSASQSFVAPRTATEQSVAAIWQTLLEVPQVSIHDNFFSLGGHSLRATQVISQIRQRLGVELPLSRLFQAPTVAGLAAIIDDQQLLQALQDESQTGDTLFEEIVL